MIHAHSVYKVPQGKLLKISLDYDDTTNVIQQVCLTGDFFIHPEEGLELLEQSLSHTTYNRDAILKRIQHQITAHQLILIGVTAEGLTEGIMRCRP